MDDPPRGMLKDGRPRDQEFHPNEELYRRVPPQLWDDKSDPIEIDAIDLPDMSVLRSKYAHPEWTRFDEHGSFAFADWGIVGFHVRDIPSPLLHLGSVEWTFEPRHVPLDKVFPHSEVQAFENAVHVNAKAKLEPEIHLRWREQLLRRIKKVLGPYEHVSVRIDSP